MKRLEPVSKIMTKEVITLGLSDSLYKAEKLFRESHIRHIPVVKDDSIIGMLSLSDLKRISFLDAYDANEVEIDNAIYQMLSIEQIMVKNPIKITPAVLLFKAALLENIVLQTNDGADRKQEIF